MAVATENKLFDSRGCKVDIVSGHEPLIFIRS